MSQGLTDNDIKKLVNETSTGDNPFINEVTAVDPNHYGYQPPVYKFSNGRYAIDKKDPYSDDEEGYYLKG